MMKKKLKPTSYLTTSGQYLHKRISCQWLRFFFEEKGNRLLGGRLHL